MSAIMESDVSDEFVEYKKASEFGQMWNKSPDDVNQVDAEGNTQMHTSCQKGEVAVCMILFMKGAKIDLLNNLGQTPLHCAAFSGNYQLCCFLLKAGCSAQLMDGTGKIPLDYVPEEAINTKKLLTIAKTHPKIAKELASSLVSKKESPSEKHYKKLGKLATLVQKQLDNLRMVDEEIAKLEASGLSLNPKEYQKNLQRLEIKRDQIDNEFDRTTGTMTARKNTKNRLSWKSLFSF